jgi:hypothetical protein
VRGLQKRAGGGSQAMQIGRRRPKIITLGWLGQGQVPALSSLPPTTTILPLSSQSGPVPPSKPNMSTTTLSDEAETSYDDVSIDGSGILRSAPYLDSPLLSGLFEPYADDKRCVWVDWAADAPPRPFNTGFFATNPSSALVTFFGVPGHSGAVLVFSSRSATDSLETFVRDGLTCGASRLRSERPLLAHSPLVELKRSRRRRSAIDPVSALRWAAQGRKRVRGQSNPLLTLTTVADEPCSTFSRCLAGRRSGAERRASKRCRRGRRGCA